MGDGGSQWAKETKQPNVDGWADVNPTIKVKKAQSKIFDNGGSVDLTQLNQLETALGSQGVAIIWDPILSLYCLLSIT